MNSKSWPRVIILIAVLASLLVTGIPVAAARPVPTANVVLTIVDNQAVATITWENVRLNYANLYLYDVANPAKKLYGNTDLRGRTGTVVVQLGPLTSTGDVVHTLEVGVLLWDTKGDPYSGNPIYSSTTALFTIP